MGLQALCFLCGSHLLVQQARYPLSHQPHLTGSLFNESCISLHSFGFSKSGCIKWLSYEPADFLPSALLTSLLSPPWILAKMLCFSVHQASQLCLLSLFLQPSLCPMLERVGRWQSFPPCHSGTRVTPTNVSATGGEEVSELG